MKRIVLIMTLQVFLFGAFFAGFAQAQTKETTGAAPSPTPSSLKIGIIDVNRIIEEHPVSIAWDEELSKLKTERENLVKDEIQKKYGVTDESQLSEAQKSEIQQFIAVENEKFRQEMIPERNNRLKQVEDDILSLASEAAKKEGLEMILDKVAVIYGGTDITDKLLNLIKEKQNKKQ